MIIGAGWVKNDKNGNKYLSCSIEVIGKKFYFSLFPYQTKEGETRKENSPDYNIVTFSEDRKEG